MAKIIKRTSEFEAKVQEIEEMMKRLGVTLMTRESGLMISFKELPGEFWIKDITMQSISDIFPRQSDDEMLVQVE